MLTECPECRYSLAGLPANHRCPECGFEYDETMKTYLPRTLSLRIVAIFMSVLAVGLTLSALYAFFAHRYWLLFLAAAPSLVWIPLTWIIRRKGSPMGYISFGRERIVWRLGSLCRNIRWVDVTDVTYSEARACVRLRLGPSSGHHIPPLLLKPIGPGPAVARHFRQLAHDARRAANPQNRPG